MAGHSADHWAGVTARQLAEWKESQRDQPKAALKAADSVLHSAARLACWMESSQVVVRAVQMVVSMAECLADHLAGTKAEWSAEWKESQRDSATAAQMAAKAAADWVRC